jgi:MFS family permease
MGATLGSAFAFMVGGTVLLLAERLGQLSIPLLGDVHGWQAVFLAVGIPGLVIALVMLATVREPVRREGAERAALRSEGGAVPLRAVAAYVYARKRAFGAHIISMALWVTAGHGLLVWSPTYLIRAFDFTHAEAGWTFGLIMLTAGTAGLLVGGSLADWLMRRGYVDSFNRVLLTAIVLMIPCYLCLGIVQDSASAVVCLTVTVFCFTLQGGLPAGALQLMAPNRLRGQLVALYMLVVVLLGTGLGPTFTALLTDYLFESDAAVGKSLAVTGAVLCPIAALIMWLGLKHIRAVIQETAAWEASASEAR